MLPEVSEPEYQREMELLLQLGIKLTVSGIRPFLGAALSVPTS